MFQAVNSRGQHSISFTLSRNQTVVVEYCHDDDTDMFQVRKYPVEHLFNEPVHAEVPTPTVSLEAFTRFDPLLW